MRRLHNLHAASPAAAAGSLPPAPPSPAPQRRLRAPAYGLQLERRLAEERRQMEEEANRKRLEAQVGAGEGRQ